MSYLAWLLAALAALALAPPYLIAPLRVWRSNRSPVVHARLLEPRTAPAEARAAVQALAPQARALGFDMRTAADAQDGRALVLHFINPSTRDHLLDYRTPEADWQVFVTRFAGDQEVVTSNSPAPSVFSYPPAMRVCALPPHTELADLYRAHREHIRLTVGVVVAAPADEPRFVETLERRTMETQRRIGLYARDGDDYRPTLRGAFLMTYRLLPPLYGIRARRNARLAQRLLHG